MYSLLTLLNNHDCFISADAKRCLLQGLTLASQDLVGWCNLQHIHVQVQDYCDHYCALQGRTDSLGFCVDCRDDDFCQ